ncbi:MAG TPA: lipid kinase [Clostridiales bacterium]|nr:lipid kinase [Clostridiales bacterium]
MPERSETVFVVVNPASANGSTGRMWPAISRLLREAGLEHEACLTSGPLDAVGITRQALAEGYRTVVAVGGDGTVNEVVNGFFDGDQWLGDGARLGLICRGTGCDLIKTLGLPKDDRQAVERLRAGRTRRIDLGRVRFTGHSGEEQVRYFANIGDLGLGGETVARVNRTTKAFGGLFSFLWGTLATVATYRNKDIELVIDGGEPIRGRMNSVVVANGRFFGGGMEIAPQAVMDDGLFDIVVLGNISRLELVANISRVYRGAHLDHPKIALWRGREVTVRSQDTVLLDLDGEQPGRADAVFTILPGRLEVIV